MATSDASTKSSDENGLNKRLKLSEDIKISDDTVFFKTPVPQLVVIRGPAGAGKSTIANGILTFVKQSEIPRRVCYLEQDYFRRTIHVCGGGDGAAISAAILCSAALTALSEGFTVVMEGILNMKKYKQMFDTVIATHGKQNCHFFYLDVSLDETQRRHLGREKASDFGAEKLEKWYSSAQPSRYEN